MKRWPPTFAGEPLSPEMERLMAFPLDWQNGVADWRETFAYLVSGLRHHGAAVEVLARHRLRRLLGSALAGLDALDAAEIGAEERAPARRATKKK